MLSSQTVPAQQLFSMHKTLHHVNMLQCAGNVMWDRAPTGQLRHLQLDEGVVLRVHTLPSRAVVVRARLAIQRRVDGVALVLDHLAQAVQRPELPAVRYSKVQRYSMQGSTSVECCSIKRSRKGWVLV